VLGVLVNDVKPWMYQFGQPNCDKAGPLGQWACGHASVQVVKKIWHAKRVSINRVEKLAGKNADPDNNGIDGYEVETALHALNLPYELQTGMDASRLLRISRDMGPVLFCCIYSHWPDWKGCRYYSATEGLMFANGVPNGYARPLGDAGKNQLDFDGGHWGVLLSAVWRKQRQRFDVFVRDPNHNSGSRPQRPPYDIMTARQFRVMYERFGMLRGNTVAITPTEPLVPGAREADMPLPAPPLGMRLGLIGRTDRVPWDDEETSMWTPPGGSLPDDPIEAGLEEGDISEDGDDEDDDVPEGD
jgi:hypothetical protein